MTIALRSDASGTYGAIQVGGTDRLTIDNAGNLTGTATPTAGDSSLKLATTAFATGLSPQIQSVSASVASNALTLGLNPTTLVFRNATLTNGGTVAVAASALSLVVPSGATLGTVSGVQAQLALLVAYNGGTPVLCVTNMAGGANLDETTLISPTTISSGATSSSTIYSASAVSANSPFRVVGYIQITEATAGTWTTAPTLVQGGGGQAMAAMQSLGYGQAMSNPSRSLGTSYYNTTSRPRLVSVSGYSSSGPVAIVLNLNGINVNIGYTPSANTYGSGAAIIPPLAQYSISISGGVLGAWAELS